MTNNQITTYDSNLRSLFQLDEVREQFERALGKQTAGAFMASVLAIVADDNRLQDCTPNSILLTAMKAATLGLSLEPALGQAYPVPYYNNKIGKREAQFQIGYKGLVQLAHRSRMYERINVAPVYEGEEVIEDRITGDIRLEGEQTSKNKIGYVGYFRMVNGYEQHIYMTIEEIHAHKEKYAKGYNRRDSAWNTATSTMERKTVLIQLLSHHGALSTEMRRAIEPEIEDAGELEIIDLDERGRFPDDEEMWDPEREQAMEEQAKAEQEEVEEGNDTPPGILVACGVAENMPNAAKIATGLKLTSQMSREDIVKLGKTYRGWRDSGKDSKEAYQLTLEGKKPNG